MEFKLTEGTDSKRWSSKIVLSSLLGVKDVEGTFCGKVVETYKRSSEKRVDSESVGYVVYLRRSDRCTWLSCPT